MTGPEPSEAVPGAHLPPKAEPSARSFVTSEWSRLRAQLPLAPRPRRAAGDFVTTGAKPSGAPRFHARLPLFVRLFCIGEPHDSVFAGGGAGGTLRVSVDRRTP